MSAIPILMLLMSAVMKFVKPPPVAEGFSHLGWSMNLALGLGIVELACTIIYIIPQTAVLGAILLTGYLGGAVATHVRVEEGLFPITFPIIFGALLWGGLVLRDARLRSLIPWRSC